MGSVSPENNSYPDLLIEEAETKRRIAIECKWRNHINDASMKDLFLSEQLSTYQKFSEEKCLPVFIVLGIGGSPSDPNNVYIIPLEKVPFEQTSNQNDPSVLVYEPSQLNPFKRSSIDTPLCFDEFFTKKAGIQPRLKKSKNK